MKKIFIYMYVHVIYLLRRIKRIEESELVKFNNV